MKSVHIIRTGAFGVNTIIVTLEKNCCFVVDPAACSLAGDENKIVDYLKKEKLTCVAVILTHSHFDHVTGIAPIKAAFPNCQIAIHKNELSELTSPPGPMGTAVIQFFGALELITEVSKQPDATVSLSDGQNLEEIAGTGIGGADWKVIHTPGHTPGSICLYNSKLGEKGVLISGDTIFAYDGYGRTDMAGGDEAEIFKSINRLHKEIPSGTHVYPGHDADFIF